jgi:hypothetical protein
MIDAKDLRIGNWVLNQDGTLNDKPIGVPLQIEEQDFKWAALYVPIPLSPELLLKCGFSKIGKDDNYINLIGVKIWSDGEKFYHINSEMLTHLDYLHQLQNWYYFNAGEELTITFKSN